MSLEPRVSRGRRLLLTVPAVIAAQQLLLALPGDDAYVGLWSVCWLLVASALSWAAAVRRSPTAWLLLFALCALALVWSLGFGIENDYDPAAYPYMLLNVVALGLLLSRDSLRHVDESPTH